MLVVDPYTERGAMTIRAMLIAVALSAQMLLPSPVPAAGVGQSCGTVVGIACDAGLFCETAAGKCSVTGSQGKCVQVPSKCPRMAKPVCGCNSQTYANDCERQTATISKSHNGKCS